jgi:hypothetical protein
VVFDPEKAVFKVEAGNFYREKVSA